MKKLLIATMMTLAIVAFGVATAEAAATDAITVTVTITASAVDVTLDIGTWTIGGISAGGTQETSGGAGYFTATNNRNASEDLTLTSANSNNGWTFANTPGGDQFGLNYSTAGVTPSWTLIDSSTGALLADDLAAGSPQSFDLQLEVPSTTTVGGTEQTIVVTVTAS